MEPDFKDLLAAAKQTLGEFDLGKGRFAGAVAAALKTKSGRIFTGISVDLYCGLGTCAEHASILEMLKTKETEIEKIVALSDKGIVAPCGRCRELLTQVNSKNLKTLVMLSQSEVFPLSELLPNSWLERKNNF